jgi:hypothetical protein
MKSLIETIYESTINEAADKKMKDLFGKPITFSKTMSSKFSELGMNYQHIDDVFYIYADGRIEYRNKWLFTLPRTGKVRKAYLNRIIPANDDKIFVLNPVIGHTMDGLTPYRFLRAVFNAFAQGYVEVRDGKGIITDLDYTKGDFEKDLKN